MIVDADMGELPAKAALDALATAIADAAMADSVAPIEPTDTHVKKLAGLVAHHREGNIENPRPRKPCTPTQTAVLLGTPILRAISASVPRR